jgi:hypothetical protein
MEDLGSVGWTIGRVDTNKLAVIISDKAHEPATVAILSRGRKFSQTTNMRSYLKEVVSGVEQAIHHLAMETASEEHLKSGERFSPRTKARQPSCYEARTTLTKL